MPLQLSKGQKISLKKEAPGLDNIMVGLGWDAVQYDNSAAFDLDATAFLLGAGNRCTSEANVIFYNNKVHQSGCIQHEGDNRTGDGEGDDEVINVILSKVPQDIEKIDFTVTIDQAEQRRQNFGMVSRAYIRICNPSTGEELIRYDLSEDFSLETAIVVASLYRNNGEWKFSAVGQGYNGGLAALCNSYGIETDQDNTTPAPTQNDWGTPNMWQ